MNLAVALSHADDLGRRWTPSRTVYVRPTRGCAPQGGTPPINGYQVTNQTTDWTGHARVFADAIGQAAAQERANLRAQAKRYAVDRTLMACEYDMCDHPAHETITFVPGAVPIVIRTYTDSTRNTCTVVRYVRRNWGGFDVVRADNGRILGWITKDQIGWAARIAVSAFRGNGPDDEGDVLDKVPSYLPRATDSYCTTFNPITTGAVSRVDAAEAIVTWLDDHQAPAVGYPRHPAVKAWQPVPRS